MKSFLKGIKDLLGAGLYLLLAAILIEALTIYVRHWISFPVSLSERTQIAMTIPFVFLCLSGMIWFNKTLNLAKTYLLGGEHKLITKGPFKYVRHPLYSILLITLPPLMIIWYADMLFLIPWLVIFVIAHYIILLEERGLLREFGEDYARYRKHVPALLPYKFHRNFLLHSRPENEF